MVDGVADRAADSHHDHSSDVIQASAVPGDRSSSDGLGRQVDTLTRVVTQLVRGAGDLQTALSFAQPQQVTVRLGTNLALEGTP